MALQHNGVPRARRTTLLLALFSDVHSNLEALDACLRHARARAVERVAFLGDLVGYGADPQGVIDVVARLSNEGAIAVKGNHDEAVGGSSAYLNDAARAAIEWTRGILTAEQKRFLSELPLCVREERMCFVHASAAMPQRWDYVDGPSAAKRSVEAAARPYTFSGHVHDQTLYFEGAHGKMSAFHPTSGTSIPIGHHRRWLAIVGSVGQPRDRNPAAAYALFDTVREQITFHRVAYDSDSAAAKIRSARLPESLVHRVKNGI